MKFKIHSVVDVITNSSTVIYAYQNSVDEAKDLVAEVLKLTGIEDKSPDDIFYYGVFCEDEKYFDSLEDMEENDEECTIIKSKPSVDAKYGTDEYKAQQKAKKEWWSNVKLSIMKGEIKKPKWMITAEEGDDDWWSPTSYLELIPKDEKYAYLGNKIQSLLGSVDADGGRDG